MNNGQRIVNKRGGLPLAPKVAAAHQRFSATPSAGDTPRMHGRAVRVANDQAATPLVREIVEVQL